MDEKGKKTRKRSPKAPPAVEAPAAAAAPEAASWEKAWQERVGAFAAALRLDMDAVNEALKSIVGEPSEEALGYLANEELAPTADIQAALTKTNTVPTAAFKANVGLLRGPKAEAPTAAETAIGTITDGGVSTDILPQVPDDDSFTVMLKVGGELKVGVTEVLSAVKAALAARVGLYDLPDKLKAKMEEFAEVNDEPVGRTFFDLRNLVVKRQYADILSALGIEGSFMSESRKNRFLSRLDQGLWNEIYAFHQQLVGWQRNWMDQAGNPAIMMTFLGAAVGGAGALPPGIMQTPETDTIRDAAEAVVNKINKVFAGVGIPIARALAYDAQRIKDVLLDDRLPAAVGAANRDQMLKMLGADVTSDYPRMERNLVKYILSVMELQKVTAGRDEIAYLGAMLQLGNAVPWAKLMNAADGSADKPRREAPFGGQSRSY